jgi:hypothetical protein
MNFPLFVKGIAYRDEIKVVKDESGYAKEWEVVKPSGNSLIWIFEREPSSVLDELSQIGCGIESGEFTKLSAVNVPPTIGFNVIEATLKPYEDIDKISVAYPVDRFR